ncbi:oxidoreductase domain protein [Pseudodesulfovibrio mercurii]|uniref:Oxidoreductase domain protein n=1 Tax=Pseudodesulfovibrio mercurii TaxID=641491 RepID=F0JJN7_9BACT|nr:Gfo/Idh/MocA family oxidoreductase [Pseudodesulfovibrio mercurii]EGB16136.1 oxidoreductase domain protein [Pseudodesulfovibrio mercurii]
MKTIRIGVLSTARIGRTKVIPGMQKARNCTVEAICSRDESAARRTAEALNIPKAYGSYEALLADPGIDAVYNPLPNHLHVEWTLKAMARNKHVLCEKPLGLNDGEVNRLINAMAVHPEVKVMEAFMYRFHPQWVETKRLIDRGAIGRPTSIQSFFSYFNADPGNIRNKADMGGGGLMDIGCYQVSLSRLLFDAQPRRVLGWMDRDPEFGTDRTFSGLLDFGGRLSAFTCSTQLAPYQRVNVLGEKGRIEIIIPFNAPPDAPTEILLQQDRETHTITFDPCDQYTLQAEAFARAVLEDTSVPISIMDTFANQHTVDALFKSAEADRWENC